MMRLRRQSVISEAGEEHQAAAVTATTAENDAAARSSSSASACTKDISSSLAKQMNIGRSVIERLGMRMGRKLEKLTTQTVLGLDRMVHPSMHEAQQDAHAGEDVVQVVGSLMAPQTEGNVVHHLRSMHMLSMQYSNSFPPQGNSPPAVGQPTDSIISPSLGVAHNASMYVGLGPTGNTLSPASLGLDTAADLYRESGNSDSSHIMPSVLHARGDLLLLVVVHSARNLPPIMPDTNSVNPFVRLTMGDLAASSKGSSSAKPLVSTCTTRTIWRSRNPVWEESFLFEIKGMAEDTPISAVVYHNYGTGNIRMGQTRATLKRLFMRLETNRAVSTWFRLGPRNMMEKSSRGHWQGFEGDISFTQALVDRHLAPTLQPMLFSIQQLTPMALQQRLQGRTLKVTLHSLRVHLKRAEEMAGIMQVLADKDYSWHLEVQVGRTVAKRPCRAVHAEATSNDPLDVTLTVTVSGGGYLLVPLDNAFQVQEALFWARKKQENEIGDIKIYLVHVSKGTLARTQIPCWDVPTEEQLLSTASKVGDESVKEAQAQQQATAWAPKGTDAAGEASPAGTQPLPWGQSKSGAGAPSAVASGHLEGKRTSVHQDSLPHPTNTAGPDEVAFTVGEQKHLDLRQTAAAGKLENGLARDAEAFKCKDGKQYLRLMDDYERVTATNWELTISCVMVSEEQMALLAKRQAAADDNGPQGVVTTVVEADDGSGSAGQDKEGDGQEGEAVAEDMAAEEGNGSMLLPPPLETSCCDCTVNAAPANVFHALFDHSHPVFKGMVAREKLTNVLPEPWSLLPSEPGMVPPQGAKRMLKYTRPLAVPMGPKSCTVEEVHEITASSAGGWVALVKVFTTAPKGDSFYVNIQFAVSRVNKNSSRLVSSCAFVLVKSLGLLKSVVQVVLLGDHCSVGRCSGPAQERHAGRGREPRGPSEQAYQCLLGHLHPAPRLRQPYRMPGPLPPSLPSIT